MISTRDLSGLQDVDGLRHTMQSMAMLDAIVSPNWEYRYWSFNAAWAPNEQMGSMRNGSGDDLFAHFSVAGCWLKGFAHEAPMSPFRVKSPQVWLGVLDAVPAEFQACLRDPAFEAEAVTFCIWRTHNDTAWQMGPVEFRLADSDLNRVEHWLSYLDPDGSETLLSRLDGKAETYRDWALDYYERSLELSLIEHVWRHQPLTAEVVGQLNPKLSLADLAKDIAEIGYPR